MRREWVDDQHAGHGRTLPPRAPVCGGGRLLRRFKDGKAGIPGYVEDYAYLTAGLAALGRQYLPNLLLTRIGRPRAERPIWAGKEARDGAPTAYVCQHFACSPPATGWGELAAHLGAR